MSSLFVLSVLDSLLGDSGLTVFDFKIEPWWNAHPVWKVSPDKSKVPPKLRTPKYFSFKRLGVWNVFTLESMHKCILSFVHSEGSKKLSVQRSNIWKDSQGRLVDTFLIHISITLANQISSFILVTWGKSRPGTDKSSHRESSLWSQTYIVFFFLPHYY